jgi:hypothetical protein
MGRGLRTRCQRSPAEDPGSLVLGRPACRGIVVERVAHEPHGGA